MLNRLLGAIAKLYEPDPPLALNCWEYCVFVVTFSVELLAVTFSGLTLRVNVRVV